jgi:hypothetical protein
MPQERPQTITPITAAMLAPILVEAWRDETGEEMSTPLRDVLVGHSALETWWWKLLRNNNLGNHKSVEGDGFDWVFYDAVPTPDDPFAGLTGEELPIADAEKLLAASPELVRIKRRYTQKKSGEPYASVLFYPPHPISRFRSYASLREGARYWIRALLKSWRPAVDVARTGNADAYARALKVYRYYTADVDQYAEALVGVVAMVRAQLAPKETPMPAAPAPMPDAIRAKFDAIFAVVPGETSGEYAARVVRAFDRARPDAKAGVHGLLYWLAESVEGADAAAEQYRTTNCATSWRWLAKKLGCPHKWCGLPDKQIRKLDPSGPVSWNLKIARDMGALIDVRGMPKADVEALLGEGWGIHYNTPGTNDSHMEWCLDSYLPDPEPDEHGGGGRAGNEITVERGNVMQSLGRPIAHIIDPSKMGFATSPRPNTPTDLAILAYLTNEGRMPSRDEIVTWIRAQSAPARPPLTPKEKAVVAAGVTAAASISAVANTEWWPWAVAALAIVALVIGLYVWLRKPEARA